MKLFKNSLSVLLAVIMLVTSMPMTAFSVERAAVADTTATATATTGSTIDSPGIVTTKSVSYDAATGGYNLNIEAYVTGKTVDNVTGVPLDIVMVMDHSNSMPDCIKCEKGSLGLTQVYAANLSTSTQYYLDSNEMAYYCSTCKAWYTQVHSSTYNYHEGTRLVPRYDGETSGVVQFYTATANELCPSSCGHKSERHPIYEAQLYNADGSVKSQYTVICDIPGDTGYKTVNYCSVCKSWYNATTANINEHNSGDHSSSNHCYPLRSADEAARMDKFYVTGTCNKGGTHVSRFVALYEAVLAFLASVEADAKGSDGVFGTSDDTHHRIAFVSFAGDSTGEDSTNAILSCTPGTLSGYSNRIPYKLIDGDNENDTVYKYSFQDVTTYDGRKIANTCLNNRLFSANTQTTKGMKMAYKLFTLNTTSVNEAASGDRSRVCIVFTDGEPTDTPADSIKIGAQIHDLKVPVYTVGTFSDAIVAVPATAAEVKALPATSQYMHLLSSNYPDAVGYSNTDNMGLVNPDVTIGQEAYFLSSTTTDGLKAVFQKIYSQIESPDVSLGSTTVLQDVVNTGFIVDTSRTVTAQVKYYSNNAVVRSITPSVNGNTVTVTGFDYSANFVNTSTKSGQKMVLTIPIKPTSTVAGVLSTNVQASSGIYYSGDLLETLPMPYAEVPATVTVKKDCLTNAVNVSGTGFSGSYTGGGSGGTLSMGTNSYSVQSTNLATQLTPKLKLGTNLYISGANSGVTVSVSGSTATQSGDNWVISVKQGMVVTVTKHNIVVDAYKAPTCTATGLTEGKHCTGCSTQTVAQTTIAATGHNYKLKGTVAATYFADGYEYWECLNDPSHNYKTTLTKLTDTSAPTVNATYPTPTLTEDDKVYFGSDVTVDLTANDAESHIKEATYTVTNTDTNTTYSSGDLTINGANAVGDAPITADGYYTVTVSATNTQGGSASTTTKTIVVDKTKPVIKEVASVPYQSVTVNVTDRHLTTVTVDGVETYVDENGNILLTREFGTGDKTYTIVATDIVGNSSEHVVTIDADKTPPYITITHDPASEFSRGPVDVTIKGEDKESGIKNIRYTVKLNGEILEDYNNAAVNADTVTESFTADGYYEITAISTNNEGLESLEALESFIIDTTAPVITLPTEGRIDGNIYCNSPDGIVVGITELNPKVITVTKPDGSVTTIVGGIPTILLTGSLEGSVYTVKIVDKAGNEATETVTVYDQHPFGKWEITKEPTYTEKGERERICTVCGHKETEILEKKKDETAPTVDAVHTTVDIKDGETDYFTAKPVTVTVTATDEQSNLASATYTLTKDGVVVDTYPLIVSDDGKTATADVVLTEDGEYTITVNAKNTQNGEAETLVTNKIVIDTKAPEATVTPVELNNTDNELDITSDKYIEADDLKNDTITNKDVTVTVVPDDDVVKTEYIWSNTAIDLETLENSDKWSETVPEFKTDGEYIVYVKVTDEAGNYTIISTDIIEIDKTPPAYTVESSNTYGKVTVTVSDINLVPETVVLTYSDGEPVPENEYTRTVNSDGTVTFVINENTTEDCATKSYKIVAYDKADNFTQIGVIANNDIIDPTVDVDSDLEADIRDDNIDYTNNQRVTVTLDAWDNNGGIGLREEKPIDYVITLNGNKYLEESCDPKDTVTLTEQGRYVITAKATDKRGNESTPVVTDVIYIDYTDPYATLTPDVTTVSNQNVVVRVVPGDAHSGVAKVEYLISTSETLPEDGVWTELAVTGGDVTVSNAGEQYVYVKVTDKAGNVSVTRSEKMIIDSDMPVITLPTPNNVDVDGTKLYCNAADGIPVTFTETNPDVITVAKKDGDATTIVNGTPTVVLTGSLEGEEYTITVTDKAGNVTAETVKVYSVHPYGDWEQTDGPTCTVDGEKQRTCTVCGHVDTAGVDKLGHNYGSVVTNPTCTEGGYTTHTCSRCNDTYRDTSVAALGHDWEVDAWSELTVMPTADANGDNIVPGEYTHHCGRDANHTYKTPAYPVAQNVRTGECYLTLYDALNDKSISYLEPEEFSVEALKNETYVLKSGDTVRLLVDFTATEADVTAAYEGLKNEATKQASHEFLMTTTAAESDVDVNFANVTLDLDDHTLKVTGTMSVNTYSHVINSHAVGNMTGKETTEIKSIVDASAKLIVPISTVAGEANVLRDTNSQVVMRVSDDEVYYTYVFVLRSAMNQYSPVYFDTKKMLFIFRPTLGTTELNQYFFLDGCRQEGVEIGMRFYITEYDETEGENVTTELDIMYNDDVTQGEAVVNIVYRDGRAFEITVNDLTVYSGKGSVTATGLLKSETGVELKIKTPITITIPEATETTNA